MPENQDRLRLAVRYDDGRVQQRTDRVANMAADLEHALRETLLACGGLPAIRVASGWNTAEPVPTRAAEAKPSRSSTRRRGRGSGERRAHPGHHRVGQGLRSVT